MNIVDMKTFRRIINLVANNFQFRFHKGHLQNLLNRIREEFKNYFALETEGEIKVNACGLTGAGLHFVNSTLKAQLRLQSSAERLERFTFDF